MTMTAKGLLTAFGPLALVCLWAAASKYLGAPSPPAGAWELVAGLAAAGLGIAGQGFNRRDQARGGSYTENSGVDVGGGASESVESTRKVSELSDGEAAE